LAQQIAVQRLPVLRCHEHIDPGIEGLRATARGAAGNLRVAVPIADQKAVETHPALQHFLKQIGISMHFQAIPRTEGHHRRLRAAAERGAVAGGMDPRQLGLAHLGIALVHAAGGAAVAQKVLGGGQHLARGHEAVLRNALHTLDQRRPQLGHQAGLLGIAFVGAPPAVIARHSQRGREIPIDAGGRNLPGGGGAYEPQQLGVRPSPQADIVRKKRGPEHVIGAMHGIRSPNDRNGRQAVVPINGRVVEGIRQSQPVGRGSMAVAVRKGAAAVQHRAQPIALHVLRR